MKAATKMVEVYGYEASDGKWFKDRDECEKYEASAVGAASAAANCLKEKDMFADAAFGEFCTCCENSIRTYNIKDANDLQVINTYLKSVSTSGKVLSPEYIGHRVAIEFYDWDSGYMIVGTQKEAVGRFVDLMDMLFDNKVEE